MKKKLLNVMLAAAVAVSLAGCSGELSNEYVTVTQYKGLEVPQPAQPEEVTDDQVEQTIESNLSASATQEPVDRAAQNGDILLRLQMTMQVLKSRSKDTRQEKSSILRFSFRIRTAVIRICQVWLRNFISFSTLSRSW